MLRRHDPISLENRAVVAARSRDEIHAGYRAGTVDPREKSFGARTARRSHRALRGIQPEDQRGEHRVARARARTGEEGRCDTEHRTVPWRADVVQRSRPHVRRPAAVAGQQGTEGDALRAAANFRTRGAIRGGRVHSVRAHEQLRVGQPAGDRTRGVGPDAQSARLVAHVRRIERRRWLGGRSRNRAGRTRERWRRKHSHSCVVQRSRRAQAESRPSVVGAARRRSRVQRATRGDAHGRRHCRGARRGARAGRRRRSGRTAAGAALSARSRGTRREVANRRARPRPARCARRPRVPRRGEIHGEVARVARPPCRRVVSRCVGRRVVSAALRCDVGDAAGRQPRLALCVARAPRDTRRHRGRELGASRAGREGLSARLCEVGGGRGDVPPRAR